MLRHSDTYRESDGEDGVSISSFAATMAGKELKYFIGDSLGTLYCGTYANEQFSKEINRLSEDGINAIGIHGKEVCVGAGSTTFVEDSSHESFKLRSSVCRRTLPVSCCCFDHEGKYLFVCSQEPGVQVYLTSEDGGLAFTITTNGTGIRFIRVGANNYFYMMDYSGNLIICKLIINKGLATSYDVEYEAKFVVDMGIIRDEQILYKLDCCDDRLVCIVPSKLGSLLCCYGSRDSEWKESYLSSATFSHKDVAVHIAAFSSDGTKLVSGDTSGNLIVWKADYSQESPIFSGNYSVQVSLRASDMLIGAAWFQSNLVGFTKFGCCVYTDRVNDELVTLISNATAKVNSEQKTSRLKKKSQAVDDDDNDIIEENTESIEAIKQTITKIANGSDAVEGEDDMESDDDEAIDVEESDQVLLSSSGHLAVYHAPINLSSTTYDEKSRRYLTWNSVGNITTKIEDMSNRIEIRFANKSRRNKQEMFSDNWGFVLAALAHEGAVFTNAVSHDDAQVMADGEKKSAPGSVIRYFAFPHGAERLYGANESFSLNLGNNEEALSLAVGCGWVAVATSRKFLRIFSSAGSQLALFWLKGPIVCLCGYENMLVVIYNACPSTQGDYHLQIDLYDMVPNDAACCRILCSTSVPLSLSSKLEWVGISVDTFQVFIQDSTGVLSVLMAPGPSLGVWNWVPVMEVDSIRKSSGHKYWPITVLDNKLAFVLLSGENKPLIYPEPVVSTHPFRIPICDRKDKGEKAEELAEKSHQLIFQQNRGNHIQYLLWEQQSQGRNHAGATLADLQGMQDKQQSEYDKTVLKLFQDACRVQKNALSIDLALKLRTEKALSAAITVANHFGRSLVAQKVEEILNFRQSLISELVIDPQEPLDHEEFHTNQSYEAPSYSIAEKAPRLAEVEKVIKQPVRNPFGVASSSSPKHKPATFSLNEFQSPSKKPALSRQSSFSQEARTNQLKGRTVL